MNWAEKYRPQTLDDVIGQEAVIKVIKGYLKLGVADMPHLLFSGDFGTGKTSTAKCIARELKAYLIEVNASEDGGIDRIRNMSRIFKAASTVTDWVVDKNGNRVYWGNIILLDEGERLSDASQRALRITLERPQSHTKVIMCVNELTKMDKDSNIVYKMDEGLIKRFDVLKFRRLSDESMKKIANKIISTEGVTIDDNQLSTFIKESSGRPRDLIRKLQHHHASTIEV